MRRAPRKAPVADRETAAEKKEAAEVPAARMSVPHGDTPEIPRVTVRVKPSETASDEKPVSSRNNSPNAADRPHPSASTETARVTLRVGPGERTNTKESAASERDQASAGAADEKTEPQTASEMPDVAAGKANKQDSVKPATLKRYRGKSSIAQQPIPPAAPAPVAGVGVLIDDGAKSAGKDFLGNDREQAKVSFDERPMPEVSPTSTPRVAVRLIPASESLDSASAPPSGNQRTSVPSSEAPARLKLTSGPENQSSNATRSTLKIVNAGQVDSRRPEKSE
ncbi:MAG TPA: hypothetical protein VMF30_13050 [Pirellulales bacterium]|nr:hypothetical protein [Pirellulales bacterium]